ncbi:hypothetical protein A2903_00950 [Candidatus Nomurabacteria bacterium RIFCSPLOWO2_01_FULL_33_17]|uniref:NYN domain-containing protein n=1 Tax=Candidatus Nomurabacteria bacterium RIFCSPLOWO2_01_FULL_33_17 TaxID=1801764 RepID=A0A1F6WPQ2_9BACT|nr:MAG: hypothetical protein A2903_00950 [Candidatus Nomurabacteria bacterium RIFCSPLOWO2_01_FULL_33_17]
MEGERVVIYIDGGNIYRALFKEAIVKGTRIPAFVSTGQKVDYNKFVQFLAGNRKFEDKKYYIGIIRDFDKSEKSKKMVQAQQKFLSGLENDGFNIQRGKIVYDHKIREKGVDVKMAIDLVIGCFENKYDTAIIVSSDTDLIPAIKYAQSKGKNIEYVGFSNHTSLAMIKECDNQRILGEIELAGFIS